MSPPSLSYCPLMMAIYLSTLAIFLQNSKKNVIQDFKSSFTQKTIDITLAFELHLDDNYSSRDLLKKAIELNPTKGELYFYLADVQENLKEISNYLI